MSIFSRFPKLQKLDDALNQYKEDRTQEDAAMIEYIQQRLDATKEVGNAYAESQRLTAIMNQAVDVITNVDATDEEREAAKLELAGTQDAIDAVRTRIQHAEQEFNKAIAREEKYREQAAILKKATLQNDRDAIKDEAKAAVTQQLNDIGESIGQTYDSAKAYYKNVQHRGAKILHVIGDEVQARINQVPTKGLKAFTGLSNFASHAFRHFCSLDRKDLTKEMDKLLKKEELMDKFDAFVQRKSEQFQAVKDAAKPFGESVATFAGVPQKSEEEKAKAQEAKAAKQAEKAAKQAEKAAKQAEKAAKQAEKKPGLFSRLFKKQEKPITLTETEKKQIGFFRNALNKKLNKCASLIEDTYKDELKSYEKEAQRLNHLQDKAQKTKYDQHKNFKGVTFEEQIQQAIKQHGDQQADFKAQHEQFKSSWEDRDTR